MKPETKKVLSEIKSEFGIIENIPSDIGLYSSRPIFNRDKKLIKPNIHTSERNIDGIFYIVRQFSPSYRQKDDKGYFYFVNWNIIN